MSLVDSDTGVQDVLANDRGRPDPAGALVRIIIRRRSQCGAATSGEARPNARRRVP